MDFSSEIVVRIEDNDGEEKVAGTADAGDDSKFVMHHSISDWSTHYFSAQMQSPVQTIKVSPSIGVIYMLG